MTIHCFCAGILVADHLCAPISHFPAAGELVLSDELSLQIGGCASNLAVNLARLGVDVGIGGCVGDDPFGTFIVDTLSGQGVATDHVRRAPGVGTSATLIVNVSGEDRRFVHAIGANACLRAEDIPAGVVASAKVFYVGGYLLLPGLEQNALAELFRHARSHGAMTVLDVVLPGEGDHFRQLEKLLPETDVFLPNEDEAAAISGHGDVVRQAERFLEAGAGSAVITCGEQGTLFMSDSARLRSKVYNVPFVGGTGAGDAFSAGYIMGLLEGEDPAGCLRWGGALGASCVRGVGATERVFNRREAKEFLSIQSLEIKSL